MYSLILSVLTMLIDVKMSALSLYLPLILHIIRNEAFMIEFPTFG